MKPWVLETQTTVAAPLPRVFAFFAQPENLQALTPPWLHFRILTPTPIEMKPGALIDYRIRLHGVPLHWRTRITCYEPGSRFIDEQIQGPYRLWRHEHTFTATTLPAPDGSPCAATICRDRVEYIPLGWHLVESWFVRPQLDRIFAYRQQQMHRLLSDATPQHFVPAPPSPALS